MRFQMPQFIEVEDKIFGPLTLKQFIYVAGGAGMCVVLFVLIPWWYVSVIPIIIVAIFSLALAFYKINNKPFITIVEAGAKYFFNSKLYVWKKEEPAPSEAKAPEAASQAAGYVPSLGGSKLKDLNWDLSTKHDASNPVTIGEDKTNT